MSVATSSKGAVLRHPDRLFVGGEWIGASTKATFDVVNPTTEEVYQTVAASQVADVDKAVAAAREAFDNGPWPLMTPQERGVYLRAIAAAITARTEELKHIWTSEMGAAQSLVALMSGAVPNTYSSYADLADTYAWEERRETHAGAALGLLVREPVGVVASILPWNGPIIMSAGKLAPALIAGCTVILKAPPEAPVGLHLMAEIIESVGLPPGVFNFLTADREASERLVRHPGVDKVSFTGSSAAGRRIAGICGERMARASFELGGKSAGVILDDYDVEKVAASISASAPLNAGQVCHSITRLIVPRARHDQLVEALAAGFSKIKVGDPFDMTTQMGPLAMKRQRDRVEGYIAKGQAEGATLAAGGGRPSHLNRGYFVEPTVFANVSNDMTIAREEIFGPVVSVIPADSEEQAVAMANDSDFGLNASVFSDDIDRVYKIARRLRTGTVGHNAWRGDSSIAFGGFKQSGIGREGGVEGLQLFLETKLILLDEKPTHLG